MAELFHLPLARVRVVVETGGGFGSRVAQVGTDRLLSGAEIEPEVKIILKARRICHRM
jgi:hypothetical protein